jgi:hypothetical protein
VTGYGAELNAYIDERVKASQVSVLKMGTVTGRDSSGARVMVIFDGGSGVAQPVKCLEDVVVAEGDRVGMVRFESDWVVVGNYTLRRLGDGLQAFQFTATTSGPTSTTLIDMPSSPTAEMYKWRDATLVRIQLQVSCLVTTTGNTSIQFGMHVASDDGVTAYDEIMFTRVWNTAAVHGDVGGAINTGALPGNMNYAFTVRWARVGGTGTPQVSVSDSVSIQVKEVAP